jgi:hypothetical protein
LQQRPFSENQACFINSFLLQVLLLCTSVAKKKNPTATARFIYPEEKGYNSMGIGRALPRLSSRLTCQK